MAAQITLTDKQHRSLHLYFRDITTCPEVVNVLNRALTDIPLNESIFEVALILEFNFGATPLSILKDAQNYPVYTYQVHTRNIFISNY
jgi:hypothetical protein